MKNPPVIIAEVKTQSPFGFKSSKSWEELFTLANKVGDIISIHTDSRWGGSCELVEKGRNLTNKPILAKGIHMQDEEIFRAIKAGADFVLVVGRIPNLSEVITPEVLSKCIIEPNNLEELIAIPETFRVVWNSRDLVTGGKKKEMFTEARKLFKGWLCQASNISSVVDIQEGADAVLVGSDLEKFAASLSKS